MKRKPIFQSVDLFSEQKLISEISRMPLAELKLKDAIPWESFRETLSTIRGDYSKGGRPPYDEVFMFKCLILQTLYNLSDESLEMEIRNRNSFRIFLGMSLASDAPDRNTIWSFREKLSALDLLQPLFERFHAYLSEQGLLLNNGHITDSTFVETPRQRNDPDENRGVRSGQSRDEVFPDRSPQSKSHKDVDARWTRKGGERHFGYKDHVTIDRDSKLITQYAVTSANIHDGTVYLSLLPDRADGEQYVYADSAYGSQFNLDQLIGRGFIPEINEKGCRFRKLTESQRLENNRKSRIRARVEHVFAEIKRRMKGGMIHTIGLARAKTKIGLMNLTYNLRRYVTLTER